MTYQTLLLDLRPPFAFLTLNRPERRNAMNFAMMGELLDAVQGLNANPDIRAIILSGAGDDFCAGGDIADLQAPNLSDAEQDQIVGRLDAVLKALNESPKVIVAKLEGAVMGGGFGLACVADIGIASTTAEFALPEVRLGLAPSLIAPYVIQRIGLTRERLLMLTGVRFDGVSAHEYGIINEVCPGEILDQCVNAILDQLRLCSPAALVATKALIHTVINQPNEQSLPYRARLLNQLRTSEEGQEGMSAFRQKRPPQWAVMSDE